MLFMFSARFLMIVAALAGIMPSQKILAGSSPAFINDSLAPVNLTLTYAIRVEGKKAEDIKETYNGGKKTIFFNGDNTRLRLVSLMRTQSIFFTSATGKHMATIIRESGTNKFKFYLDKAGWASYNAKYHEANYSLTGNSLEILGYKCKEAILILADKKTVNIFFTDSVRCPSLGLAEPIFAQIPGVVLKYSYRHPKGLITYTAENISFLPIDKDVFRVPERGYMVRNYPSNSKTSISTEPY